MLASKEAAGAQTKAAQDLLEPLSTDRNGSASISQQNSGQIPKPNHYAIIPKPGSIAETRLKKGLLPSTKNRLNEIGAKWQGGSFDKITREWEYPDRLYRSIPMGKEDLLLDLFKELDIEIKDVALTPVYVSPPLSKGKRSAKRMSKEVASHRQQADDLRRRMTAQIEEAERLYGVDDISKEDRDERILEAQKLQSEIDALQVLALKKEETEFDLIHENVMGDKESFFLIEPGKLHEASNHAFQILSDPNLGVFQQNARLVRIVRYQTETKDKQKQFLSRQDGALLIQPVDEVFIVKLLSQNYNWAKFDSREKKPRSIEFPDRAAKYILVDFFNQPIPYLHGFVCSPTLRQDGTLLQDPGYDSRSGLFFDPCGTVFSRINESPARSDCVAALALIKDLLKDFSFDSQLSRSVAIAETMTGVIRKSLRLCPYFLNDACVAGAGKTLIANVTSYIATGKSVSMLAPTDSEEELEKRYGVFLIEGDRIICMDNVDFVLQSNFLCAASTNADIDVRILGKSQKMKVSTGSLFLFTGNNFSVRGDLSSRFLKCRLLPQSEKPEERQFDRDLDSYVPENRAKFVEAILTMILGYLAAGEPCKDLKPFRTFHDFTRFVRAPLVWLGEPDPHESAREIRNEDSEKEELGSLLEAWYGAFKLFPVECATTKKLSELLRKEDTGEPVERLKSLLLERFCDAKGGIDNRRLGEYLAKFQGRVVNGLRFEKHVGTDGKPILHSGYAQWKACEM